MKKIYLFLTLLLTLVGAATTTLSAQDDELISISVNNTTGDWVYANPARTWASQWQSTGTPSILIKENSGNNSGKGANNMAYVNGSIEFFNCVGGSGTEDEYVISVTEGYEFAELSLDFVASAADKGVYITVDGIQSDVNNSTTEKVHFEVTDFNSQTTSISFIVGATESSKFAITSDFVVKIRQMDPVDAALLELQEVYSYYSSTYGPDGTSPFNTEEGPGNYDATAVQDFYTALENASTVELLEKLTEDIVKQYTQSMTDSYNAVLASKKPMTLADGYYRFPTAMAYSDGTTKYMYQDVSGDNIIVKWGTLDDVTTDCHALWQVTNKDGYFDIVNMATDGRFNNITGNPVTLSTESENLMVLEPICTVEGVTYLNIRTNSQDPATSRYIYLHQNGHGGGNGTGGNLTNWVPTYPTTSANKMGASEWCVEAVSEADAQAIIEAYAPIKNRELMESEYVKMLSDSRTKLNIAKDNPTITVDEETKLITEDSQFSSPFTCSAEQEGENQGTDKLLDGDVDTYWHSDWSSSVSAHTHYLDVTLKEPVYTLVALTIQRRKVNNDHVTQWGVYGATTPDTYYVEGDEIPEGKAVGDIKEAGDWKKLANLYTPYTNNTETKVTEPFDTKGYQYLRFYIDATTTNRGYGHVSEFQLNPATMEISATSQYTVMGELATNLEKVMEDQLEVEVADLTVEQYTALKEAYDAFIAKFVDPTELRNTIETANVATAGIVIGNNPGQWSADTDAASLVNTLNAAIAYDAAGDYSAEQSAAYVEQLSNMSESLIESANKIQEGKWYRIRFASEEIYTANEWNTTAGEATVTKEVQTDEALWDKYVTIADITSEDREVTEGEGETATTSNVTVHTVVPVEAEDIYTDNFRFFFDADEDIENKDLSYFRFVNVGDSAYVMQNKATGLFVRVNDNVVASMVPSLFNISAIGYGFNLLKASNLITGANQNYLHAQRSSNVLVTWSSNTVGTASALYIEEVEDVAEDYDGTAFNMSIKPGALKSFCYPVGLKNTDKEYGNMYDVTSVAEGVISLVEIEEANAGRPFIFIYGGDYDATATDDQELVPFTHDYEFTTEAIEATLLKGTYNTINSLDRGAIAIKDNAFVISTSSVMSGIQVPANSAYIQCEEGFDVAAQYTYEITTGEDAIANVLQKVAKKGDLYTIDGRLVSRNANLNNLKNYGKGIYILNGVKISVK